ncbi:TPA: hypothetical protein I8Y21_004599 [Klebsiella oxytoca]|uniref:Uncharacterized protein n=1 Tax=Klebsiella oxytoca TaxID=571 RepID=A0AAN5LBN3_KLEOX|nr:hypothetical protein [Klebsiella oxytoca]
MIDDTNKTSLRIGGKMSEQGADKAGLALVHYLGIAAVLCSVATIIWAIKWW